MVTRIVVGFDGSASARAALAWAVTEAELRDVPLQVLTILDPPPRVMQNGPGKDLATLDDVHAAAAELTRGIAAEFRTGSGAVAAELCAACTSQDLLVLGSRGRSPFADILLGSVSRFMNSWGMPTPSSRTVSWTTPAPRSREVAR